MERRQLNPQINQNQSNYLIDNERPHQKQNRVILKSRGSIQTESPNIDNMRNQLKQPVQINRKAYGLNSEYNYKSTREQKEEQEKALQAYANNYPKVDVKPAHDEQDKHRRNKGRESAMTGQFGELDSDLPSDDPETKEIQKEINLELEKI